MWSIAARFGGAGHARAPARAVPYARGGWHAGRVPRVGVLATLSGLRANGGATQYKTSDRVTDLIRSGKLRQIE